MLLEYHCASIRAILPFEVAIQSILCAGTTAESHIYIFKTSTRRHWRIGSKWATVYL